MQVPDFVHIGESQTMIATPISIYGFNGLTGPAVTSPISI